MKQIQLEVQKRSTLGRKVRKLRAQGILPANIYGRDLKSKAVQVNDKDFEKVYKETGETSIINIKIKGDPKNYPVLIHNLQLDPLTDLPIHADFHQVNLKEKTTVEIPVELIGEAPAEKENIGILVKLLDSLEVEALPTDLPEKLEVDVSDLKEIDASVRVADIKRDEKKVKILANDNEVVAKIEAPIKEEVVAKEAPAEEGAVEKEEAVAEETKTEGEGKKPEAKTQAAVRGPQEGKKPEPQKPSRPAQQQAKPEAKTPENKSK